MMFLKSFFKGILLGLCLIPLEFGWLSNIPLAKAQDLREEIRFQVGDLREEIRGELPCENGTESCGRPTPSRPPHREPCDGCEPSIPPNPSTQPSAQPSVQPSAQASSIPSSSPGVGGNGSSSTDSSGESSSSTSSSEAPAGSAAQVLGLSYTGSGKW